MTSTLTQSPIIIEDSSPVVGRRRRRRSSSSSIELIESHLTHEQRQRNLEQRRRRLAGVNISPRFHDGESSEIDGGREVITISDDDDEEGGGVNGNWAARSVYHPLKVFQLSLIFLCYFIRKWRRLSKSVQIPSSTQPGPPCTPSTRSVAAVPDSAPSRSGRTPSPSFPRPPSSAGA